MNQKNHKNSQINHSASEGICKIFTVEENSHMKLQPIFNKIKQSQNKPQISHAVFDLGVEKLNSRRG